MTQELQEAPENELANVANWKIKYLVGGAVAGALVGLGAAYLFTQNYERRGEQAEITLWQGVTNRNPGAESDTEYGCPGGRISVIIRS